MFLLWGMSRRRMRTYYDVLGVPFGASEEVIRMRYRELAKRYHPDVNPSPEAAARMQELNEAYHVLSDPRRRLAYHLRLAAYVMRQRANPSTKRVAAPTPVSAAPTYAFPLGWILGGLLGLVVLSAVVYHVYHPFSPAKVDFSGYGWISWPAYLHLPKSIEWVNLAHNRFSAIPAEVVQLPALKGLNLSYNRMEVLPGTLVRHQQLEELLLAGNGIRAVPLGIGELSRLRRLDLRENQLKTLPFEIFSLPNLHYLDVRGNPLRPEVRAFLAKWQAENPHIQVYW